MPPTPKDEARQSSVPGFARRYPGPVLDFTLGVPPLYVYLSRRLVEDEYLKFRASGAELQLREVSAGFGGTRFVAARTEMPENQYFQARYVVEARRASVIPLSRCVPNDLTAFRGDQVWLGELRVLDGRHARAWLTAIVDDEDGAATLLALGGSLRNLIGYCPSNGEYFEGWYPSTAHGLDRFLRDCVPEPEPMGTTIDAEDWADDPRREELFRARWCARILRGRDTDFASGVAAIEGFAFVHQVIEVEEDDWQHYEGFEHVRRVVIGSPLVAAHVRRPTSVQAARRLSRAARQAAPDRDDPRDQRGLRGWLSARWRRMI